LFTVTNPTSKNGFNVASSNEEVRTILLTSQDNKVISCTLNKEPGKSFLHIANLKGRYNIIPSKIEDCGKAMGLNKTFATRIEATSQNMNLKSTSNIVTASFWDDMSTEQKERLLLEISKIAVIILIGQAF